jgi:DNA-binding transcriptional LysR family regulator
MDLLQLEHFVAVCEERTFTRAAERVFRTQSAVSQSIKKLEEEVGAPLFARDVHDVTLTESGKVVLEYARRMVRLRDETKRQVDSLKSLHSGNLSVAAHESAAVYLLPRALRRYLYEFPDIKVGIYRRPLEEVPSLVLDREIDVGFVKEKPSFHGLESVDVHSDDMILVASPRHPLVARGGVTIRDLGGEPFIVHHQCRSTEQQILRLFEQHDTQCRIVAELWSFENIKSFVREEVGLAIVPRITVQHELRSKLLAEIPLPELDIKRRTYMTYRDQGYLSATALQLIEIVRDFNWGPEPLIGPRERVCVAPAAKAAIQTPRRSPIAPPHRNGRSRNS